jgi:hypothetical protein
MGSDNERNCCRESKCYKDGSSECSVFRLIHKREHCENEYQSGSSSNQSKEQIAQPVNRLTGKHVEDHWVA